MRIKQAIGALVLTICATGATAADFSDPTWPCIQRKVESLSIGVMWPHPLEEDVALDKDALRLSEQLSLRRIAVEDLKPVLADYAARHTDHGLREYGGIFAHAFERMNRDRRRLIDGIARYSVAQIALSEKIEATRAEMERLMAADSPDYDQVDKLEEQLDWDQRIYRDRAQSLTYVCESPVLLEKRVYAIAQMMAGLGAP